MADCVLAVGFEQMQAGALGAFWTDRPSSFANFDALCDELTPESAHLPLALRYFGGAGHEHMKRYGTRLETFAKIRAKAAAMRPTIRWRCCARCSARTTSCRRRRCGRAC